MEIRQMTRQDLSLALDWAAGEGWNPGLDDAEAFYRADTGGFLMGWLGNTPVTAISAVRHNADFGFLGLYICHPDYRGQGYGWQIWQAAMARFGTRTVGLDGVVDQQENYAQSGFGFSHNTMRYLGALSAGPQGEFIQAKPEIFNRVVGFDAKISGVMRPAYMKMWFNDTSTRHTLVLEKDGSIQAVGTIRQCKEGFKIGPLYAPSTAVALALVDALAGKAGGAAVSIDVPSHNAAANALCKNLGMTPVFSTARMYKGEPPATPHSHEFGVASLELG